VEEKATPHAKGEDLLAEAMLAGLSSSYAHDVLRTRGHEGLREEIANLVGTHKNAPVDRPPQDQEAPAAVATSAAPSVPPQDSAPPAAAKETVAVDIAVEAPKES